MSTEKNTLTVHRRTPVQRIARVLLKTVLFLLLFVVVVALLLLLPPVQRYASHKAAGYLSEKLHTRVEIGSIRIGLPRLVTIENLYMEDRTHDTLIAGGRVHANIDLFRIFSNELAIKDVQFENVTAKVKRVLPDTVYNFQFVLDAFMGEQSKNPDTAASPVMKLEVRNLGLKNCHVLYKDVLTGNDMDATIARMDAKIDTLDPYGLRFNVPLVDVQGLRVRYYQTRPLTAPPVNASATPARSPAPKLTLGQVRLRDSWIDYGNETSAFYTQLKIGDLLLQGRDIDLEKQVLHLASLRLDRNDIVIRLGRKPEARAVAAAIAHKADSIASEPWAVRVDAIELNGNHIRFDNDNALRQPYGIDYAHFDGSDLTLGIQNLVFHKDSIAASVTKGNFREKSGFQLDELRGDLLYANQVAYLRNLSLRTPGTSLQRSAELRYASQDALAKDFAHTFFDVDIRDSRVQVKDILAFAPQLRSNPAFRNPSAVWTLNLQGSGTMDRLQIAALQFSGLRNTRIDASGTLAGLNNPKAAGGTFRIRRLHTSQTDIATFTGKRLDNAQMDLPENYDISGTLSGNMESISANLAMATEYGNAAVNGTFSNLTVPEKTRYHTTLSTRSLRLDRILRGKAPVGALTANFRVNGSGLTPNTINARFNGSVPAVTYNKYNYKNIRLDGRLTPSTFAVKTDVRDPNIDLTLNTTGTYGKALTFKVNGFVDSVKTLPLGFTTQPLTFRGRINGEVTELSTDHLDARLFVTEALLVSGKERAPFDSLSLVSYHNGSNNIMEVRSPFLNADLNGRYRFSDLGYIIQNNIQPYFGVGNSYKAATVQPYNITFRLDATNAPLYKALLPGLSFNQPLHADGTIASGRGINANVTAPDLAFNGNNISGLNLTVTTTPAGLQVSGDLSRFFSGSTFNIYNARLTATVQNNVIDFNLGVNDKANAPKYRLSGLLRQPAKGTYVLSLRPDSLLLNYQAWSIGAGNQLTITPTAIGANNFVLSRDGQSLAINSQGGTGSPLDVRFTNFRLGTITGFLRPDSLLADGLLNGGASFRNLPKNPLFTSDLTISDLSFRKDTIGNVALRVNNASGDRYVADVTVTGKGNDLGISGTLDPQAGGDIALDLNLAIRALQLQSLRGALASFVTDASGNISGGASIRGTTAAPKVNGTLRFNNASLSTVALGGPLTIDNEELTVTEQGFRFDNFVIRDSAQNALTLNGTVATSNFTNYNFDLDVNANNFRALNTEKRQNSLYYGKLYLDTRVHIGGTETAPVVDGNIGVKDGTALSIVIPQREPGVVDRDGVVEFVDFSNPASDTLFKNYDTLNRSDILGFDVSVNIDIAKEAAFNVIVDVAQGDLLNLKGQGNLTAGVDPSGKISLTGTYVINEGAYQFSLNFLRRRFTVDAGSRITWLGEPTAAQLDVTGRYEAVTAPLDLVEQVVPEPTQRNYFLQKLPFQILLYLRGELMKPDLSFDIQLPTGRSFNVAGDVVNTVNTRLAQLRQEPSELNKQVFAVLLLNRFVGENPFQSNGGGFNAGSFARTSVSKLLTEQLNNLASGLISGVDLNFDVASSDDYTTGERRSRTDLNVGLSKRLLNDRLQVTVGSNFQLEGPQQGNQSSNNIAGNVQVNYQLSKDGRYMLRFYRRNDYEGFVDGYVIETGLGFILSVDYNRFREVLQGRRVRREVKKREKENQEQLPPQNPDRTPAVAPAPTANEQGSKEKEQE
ncbi:translocation/assembly module TamB domain-containing protein [Flaviaesturariibacter aridisoli]|nr:translocation/assembly module TamB [Flaviaesturariibacter aridisoli]